MTTPINHVYQLRFERLAREQWLRSRSTFIGASESAAVIGYGRNGGTPFKVWASKTQSLPPIKETIRMRKGLAMEDFMTDLFKEHWTAKGVQCKPYDKGQYSLLRHPKYPFIAATLDRVVEWEDKGVGVLELKDVSQFPARDWLMEGPPSYFVIQVQHQMMVSGLRFGHIAALLSLDKSMDDGFVVFPIERDDAFIEELEKSLVHFWETYIATNTPPPVDGTIQCRETLTRMYPKAESDELVEFPKIFAVLDEKRMRLKVEMKTAEVSIRLAENKIKQGIGKKQGGYLNTTNEKGKPVSVLYEWKNTSKGRTLRRSVK